MRRVAFSVHQCFDNPRNRENSRYLTIPFKREREIPPDEPGTAMLCFDVDLEEKEQLWQHCHVWPCRLDATA